MSHTDLRFPYVGLEKSSISIDKSFVRDLEDSKPGMYFGLCELKLLKNVSKRTFDVPSLGLYSEVVPIRSDELPNYVRQFIEEAERYILLADNVLAIDLFPPDTCIALRDALVRGVGLVCVSGRCVEGERYEFTRKNPLIYIMSEALTCKDFGLPALAQYYQCTQPLTEGIVVKDGVEALSYESDNSGTRWKQCRRFRLNPRVRRLYLCVFAAAAASSTKVALSPKDYVCVPKKKLRRYSQRPTSKKLDVKEETPQEAPMNELTEMFEAFVQERRELSGHSQTSRQSPPTNWTYVDEWVERAQAYDKKYFEFLSTRVRPEYYGKNVAISFGRVLDVASREVDLFERVRRNYPEVGLYVGRIQKTRDEYEVVIE